MPHSQNRNRAYKPNVERLKSVLNKVEHALRFKCTDYTLVDSIPATSLSKDEVWELQRLLQEKLK